MTDFEERMDVTEISEPIRMRHSERVPFDPDHPLADGDLRMILEAERL